MAFRHQAKFTIPQRLASLLCAFLVAASAGAASDKELRLANEGGYPPFSDTAPDGSLYGLDVDIGNAICAEMQLKCIWIKVAWEAMIPSLISNKVDAIVASMTITEERRRKVDFTSKYYATPLALVARAGDTIRPEPNALVGRKVGLERGTVADDYASRFWRGKGSEIIRYRVQDEAYLDLKAGRLDAVLTDYWQAVGGFLNRPEGRGHAIAGGRILGRTAAERKAIGEGVGIAVRKNDQALQKVLNDGIARIRANGTYDRIVRKYFSEDIYGD